MASTYSQRSSSLRKVFYVLLTIFVLIFLTLPRGLFAASLESLPTPTLIWPKNHDQTILEKPVISGLTKNDTSIEVFIDGRLDGMAKVKNGKKETASFAHTPFLPLKPGTHTVSVKAWDNNSKARSELLQERTFVVEEPYPAPTLFQPAVNNKTVSTRPFIVGITLNDSMIKIFIDEKLDGQFQVQNSDSDVTNFAYQPFLDLDPKEGHIVYATATDSKGKESAYSNVMGFLVEPQEVEETKESPEILGVAAVQEEISKEEITTSEKEETKEESSAASVEEKKDENTNVVQAKEESEKDRSTLVWWVILIIVVVIIIANLRARKRKDITGGLKGLADLQKKEGESEKPSPDSMSQQQTLLKREESETKKSGEKKMPPPPPSK